MSQYDAWTRISPIPIESNINQIAMIPGTYKVIAVGSGASIMISENMGVTWSVSYKPANISRFISLNAVHFIDSEIGFIVGSNSIILKTTDGGASWEKNASTGTIAFKDVYFIDELNGSVIGSGVCIKTQDGGQTWDTTAIVGSSIQYINDSLGFIGKTFSSYYFKTIDSGETWQQITSDSIHEDFTQTALEFISQETGFIGGSHYTVSNSYKYIYKTVDGGMTWSEVYKHPFNQSDKFFFVNDSMGFSVGSRVMYDNMILKTTDGGDTWTECEMPNNFWTLSDIVVNDYGKGLSVGKYGQIIRSTNFGNKWQIHYESACRMHIYDAEVITDSVVFMGGVNLSNGGVPNGAIFKSVDQGNTWSKINNGSMIVRSIFFVNDSLGFYCGEYEGLVFKTVNQGNTWSYYELDPYSFDGFVVYFINDSVGFVGGEGDDYGLYKTIDGGDTWDLNTGIGLNYIEDIAFSNDSTGYLLSDYSLVMKTYDQGENWEIDYDLSFTNLYHGIEFISEDVGFIFGHKLFKTINGGQSWFQITNGLSLMNMIDINFPCIDTGYLSTTSESTIYKSTDGGESWFPIEFPSTSTVNTLSFINADLGFAIGNNGIIFKTSSGGIVDIYDKPVSIDLNNLIVYPNPASDVLKVISQYDHNNKPASIKVFNMNGNLNKKIEVAGSGNFEIDVTDLSPGLYVLVYKVGNSNYFGKFIKL